MAPVATELPVRPTAAASPSPAEEAAALVARSRVQVDALLVQVFEHAAVGIAVVGNDGEECEVVLEANASLAAIFGRTIGALRGTRALSASVDPAHAPALARATEELLRGTVAVHRGQYRFRRADGECLWLELIASLVHDDDGVPRRRLVHVLDVTAQRQDYAREREAVQRASA
jgi:PAS domain S-box-containing protein